MKPLHPQVRIVSLGDRASALYYIQVYDGEAWASLPPPLAYVQAEERARWLSDVLEHARDSALEEAAKDIGDDRPARGTREYYARCIRDLKGVRDA